MATPKAELETYEVMKKTYKISGLDCPSCVSLLEIDLEEAGIKAKCSYQKGSLEVEFDDKLDESKVFSLVKKSGYQIQK